MHQIRLLTRTFFTRVFESELMPEGLPQVQLIIWGALLAATPTTGYPLLLRREVFDSDRVTLITLSMVAIGGVCLVIWDGVFPDRRDIRNLGALPIPVRHFVIARLAALSQVYLLFAAAVCVPQSIIFGLLAAGYGDPLPRLYGITAHLLTVLLACTFVFAALIAAQCLLLLLFGRRTAQAASMTFQVLFAIGLVQLLVFLGTIGQMLGPGGQAGASTPGQLAMPPLWFFGVYQVLSGANDAAAVSLARAGMYATVGSVLLAVGLYASSYSRLSTRALEGPAPRSRGPRRLLTAPRAGARRGFHSPRRRAIRHFAIRTLMRSRTHRMMFAVYGGVALAIVMSSVLSLAVRNDAAALWQPGITMLSIPLILQFLLLVGLRVIMAVPAEPKARWAFRACEPVDRGEAVTASRDTMLTLVVWPTTGLALVQGLVFWGPAAAAGHAGFDFVAGLLLAELLMARTRKLPFACTYFPGKSRVFSLWPLYLLAFFIYTIFLAVVERELLARPARLVIFCGLGLAAAALLERQRRRTLAAQPGLIFEEEDPDLIFQGFNLSEGLAGATRPTVP